MYHEVLEEKTPPPPPHLGMQAFRRQMEYLSRHGYATVFVSDMIRRRKEGKEIPGAWVALTFDGDGRNFYVSVYPVLRKYKFKATLFVVTSAVGGDGATWDELREMRVSGLVEIGSHSHRHLPATCLSVSEARKEKTVSKALLEKNLGAPIFVYAYPYGDTSEAVLNLAQEAGYMGGVGIITRLGEFKDTDYNLPRVYISASSSRPFAFRFLLSPYYVPARGFLLRFLGIKVPRDTADCGRWQDVLDEGAPEVLG